MEKILDTLNSQELIKIERTSQSRLASVDFNNLPFGKIFSDHMLICNYKDGVWSTPEIKPYGSINFGPGLHALHYGQSVFEGMKAYRDAKNPEEVYLFRPEENFERLNRSANRLAMPSIDREIFMEGIKELLKLDKDWIPTQEGHSLYLRPFMFASADLLMATPAEEYQFIVITSPTASYYAGAVKLKVEQKYTRASLGGVGFAKAAGNYAASFYPMAEARKEGYMQLLWTDGKTHTMIEEAGTMNFFYRKGNTLYTPPTSDSILAGITRKSLIEMSESLGYEVVIRPISVQEVEDGLKAGEVSEIFGVGTAAVVSPVCLIGIGENKYELDVTEDGWWFKLKKAITNLQFGKSEDTFNWRERVI